MGAAAGPSEADQDLRTAGLGQAEGGAQGGRRGGRQGPERVADTQQMVVVGGGLGGNRRPSQVMGMWSA